jgi:hypothetical protein
MIRKNNQRYLSISPPELAIANFENTQRCEKNEYHMSMNESNSGVEVAAILIIG